ncbi:MAG: hypothetical protein JNM59_05740 [Hyphomonadaceae bacterium]|nr:hypothetical protein [Hyphomonadaceae bacterium]
MTDPRHPRRSLWLVAQDFIHVLFGLFATPEIIAARGAYLRKDWALLARWLRAGEALMRQLLAVEAAALPKPSMLVAPRPKRARLRRVMHFAADAPETWRVSFRCVVGPRAVGAWRGVRRVGPRPDGRFRNAWPLAERAEALLRVFNDPAPYAARLARRLHARPDCARAMLWHAPDLPPLVGAAGFAKAHDAALAAVAAFNTG